MPNNRHLINDFDVARPPQVLDKGIPLPGLAGYYQVDEGWCAVVTEGGIFREILQPGHYPLSRYSFWRDVKATAIDVRIQTLKIISNGEMAIQQPFPVKINLELGIEYQVVDPRRVALEIKTPLTGLYDRVIQAVRGVVVTASYAEIQMQGEGIAMATLDRLRGMQLPRILGIDVFNVLVNAISAIDVGNDAIAQRQMNRFDVVEKAQADQYLQLQAWQTQQQIAQQSRVTWEWLLMHRPEIAQQLIATHGMLAKEMIDKGLLDPAGFLNQPAGAQSPAGPMGLPGGFGGFPQFPGLSAPAQGQTPPQIGGPSIPSQLPPPSDIHARMRQEVELLEKLPGARVAAKPGTDERGIPDGSYDLRVVVPRNSGGSLTIYLVCLAGYPTKAPVVEVELDEQPTPFESSLVRRWEGRYLVEVVREARQFFG